jgi:hypothetical protein
LSLSHARTHAESGRGTASPAARHHGPACPGPRDRPIERYLGPLVGFGGR